MATKKKTTQKKAVAKKKPATTKQSRSTAGNIPGNAVRRPSQNVTPIAGTITPLTAQVLGLIEELEDYTANLRALDRKRHNGVGLRRQGFIEAALRLGTDYPQYYPHWLTTQKFQNDLNLFNAIRSLVAACRSLEEKAWNINVEASDMVYTDALEYYSLVKDAADRRVDSAEALYAELSAFFKRGSQEGDEPTENEIRRDVNSLLRGKKDGKIVVENVTPKAVKRSKKLIDETFKIKGDIKNTVNEQIQ